MMPPLPPLPRLPKAARWIGASAAAAMLLVGSTALWRHEPAIGIVHVDEGVVGKILSGVPVYPMSEMVEQLRIQQLDVAILTIPQEMAQDAANRLVEAGIHGIMNFTPIRLSVPENVRVQNVDLTNELQTLIYFLDNDIS